MTCGGYGSRLVSITLEPRRCGCVGLDVVRWGEAQRGGYCKA